MRSQAEFHLRRVRESLFNRSLDFGSMGFKIFSLAFTFPIPVLVLIFNISFESSVDRKTRKDVSRGFSPGLVGSITEGAITQAFFYALPPRKHRP